MFGLAAATLGGALISSSTARSNASSANQFTEKQLKNRHQWEVADLKAAGLNPMLSAGAAPSIGSTAMASTPDFGQALASGMNTAISDKTAEAGIAKTMQEISNLKTTQELNYSQMKVFAQQVELIKEQINVQANTAAGIGHDNVQKDILARHYQSDEASLIAKDLNVPPARYMEMLEEYFEQAAGAAGKAYYGSKLNPWNWFRD